MPLQIDWNKAVMLILGCVIIFCTTFLVYTGHAEWGDAYTIFLIILTGIGFGMAGTFYGEAKAYKEILMKTLEKTLE